MEKEQQKILLKIIREQVTAAVKHQPPPTLPDCTDPQLNEHRGCFVTLKNTGSLRGCIGQFTADKPLIKLIAEMAVAAATKDPRFVFDPISSGELPSLDIEVSVLSPLKKTSDPLSLRLGIDGIYIVKGYQSGCFLPQVATETGWTKEEFLTQCCSHKAGMTPDAWKDSQTDVYLFTADIFGASFVES